MNWHMQKYADDGVQNVPQENKWLMKGNFLRIKVFQLINEGIIDVAYSPRPREIMDAGTDYECLLKERQLALASLAQ